MKADTGADRAPRRSARRVAFSWHEEEGAATAEAGGDRGSATVAPLVARHPDRMASPSPPGDVEAEGEALFCGFPANHLTFGLT
jgi:hypothetical protein